MIFDDHKKPYLWLIKFIGLVVPRRLRADWRQEWEAELRFREELLADWDNLNWRTKLDLLWRSLGAFRDALLLQPKRLEDEMFHDLRYGARMLLKNPGFSAMIVLTLALGIGANAALFSVVNGVLLNPMPFPQPEQLVTLHQSKPNFDTGAIPYPNFLDWKKENKTFSAMAISRGFGFTLTNAGEAERVGARWVSADFFSVLGVKPYLGRTFRAGEDEFGAAPVALISESLWRRKFESSPDAVGKSIEIGDKSFAIVGVIPESFSLFPNVAVYAPIGQWNTPALRNRAAALGLHGIGRLKPGISVAQGQADLERVMRDLAVAYPETNKGNSARIVPLKERIVGDIGLLLWLLLGAVGCVLMIACVNVSNLLLARSTGRMREFAIRSALGAGRGRLLRQSLIESSLLAFAGGALGLLIAGWGVKAAIAALPTTLPRSEEISMDGRVLLFTIAVALFTGILSGLAPALRTSQGRLAETLKEGGRGASSGRARAQGVFVAVEMALAVILLIGAGLMIRSLTALWKVDPGFRSENVLTFGLSFPPASASAGQSNDSDPISASLRQLSDRIGSAPGVQAASFSAGAFPLLDEDDLFFWIEGQQKPASQSEMNMALVYRVEPGYLKAMGIPLKQGRFFTPQDDEKAPNIAVIDEILSRKYFGAESPLGRRIYLGDDPFQIIGVVGHVKQWDIGSDERESLQAQLYLSFRGLRGGVSGVRVVARFEGSEKTLPAVLDSIRRIVKSDSSLNVISRQQTMNDVIAGTLSTQRFSMTLLNSFAAAALLLASVGLYGVISYLVGQRSHELGIRIALGAERNDILRLVINHGMKMSLSGVAIGLIAAFGLTRFMNEMLYGVKPSDPMTFAVISLTLGVVALLACSIPAWRATKVDPIVALRHD